MNIARIATLATLPIWIATLDFGKFPQVAPPFVTLATLATPIEGSYVCAT